MSQRVTEQLYTVQEFEKMPEANERYELLNGKLVEKPTIPKYDHNRVIRRIMRYYDKFDPEEQLGEMMHETSFRLSGDTAPAPDASFYIASRKPKSGTPMLPPPDLAIEVQSPDQSLPKLKEKAESYIQSGVRLVWLIQPKKKIVLVYQPGQTQPITVAPTGQLDGGDVIPGFTLDLSSLFED